MRVAVLIKQVPDTDRVRMDETTGTLIRDGAGTVPNLLDLHALSALGTWFPDHPGLHVTAFSMGPATAEVTLREALALGAHEAVLLCDRAFAGADTWATALTLEAALRRLGPFDLVLCGEKATDGETGQVGPELAVLLGLPFATRVREASFGDGRVRVTRLIENGQDRVDLPLPCLLTVTAAVAPMALPTLAGKMAARRARVRRLDADTLELDPAVVGLAGSPTRVVRLERPVLRRDTRVFPPGRSSEGTDAFFGVCARLGLIPGTTEEP
jgi:electron transfer flavoprotein beta subunit